jgi:fructokinase
MAASPPLVLCLGEALVDRLGPLGGDPASAPAGDCDDRLGGAPANVACALARLGRQAAFLGRLGRDPAGEALAALFRARGVDTSGLQWDAQRPTRIVLVRRDLAGERQFGGFAGNRGEGFADEALQAVTLPQQASWLLVGTLPLAGGAAAALERAVEQAGIAGVALAVDVNWRPTFWDDTAPPDAAPRPEQAAAMLALLQRATLLKCAAEEAQWLFGSADPEQVRAALPQQPAVVVTDGAAPLRWCLGRSSGVMAPYRVPVLDSTGAGDAFTAGLLHGLVARPDLLGGQDGLAVEQLMRFASGCGALVCQGAGAIDPQPTAAQVEAFLAARQSGPPH